MFPFESCQKKIQQQQQQQQQQQSPLCATWSSLSFGKMFLRFPTSTNREPASRSASLQNLGWKNCHLQGRPEVSVDSVLHLFCSKKKSMGPMEDNCLENHEKFINAKLKQSKFRRKLKTLVKRFRAVLLSMFARVTRFLLCSLSINTLCPLSGFHLHFRWRNPPLSLSSLVPMDWIVGRRLPCLMTGFKRPKCSCCFHELWIWWQHLGWD